MKQTHERVKNYLAALRLIGDWRSEGLIAILSNVDEDYENHIEPEIHDPRALPVPIVVIEEDDLATIGLAETVANSSLPEPDVDADRPMQEIELQLPAGVATGVASD